MNRRAFCALAAVATPAVLTGCVAEGGFQSATLGYRAVPQLGSPEREPYDLPNINMAAVPVEYRRQYVDHSGRYAPGTLVVDTSNTFLYLIQEDNTAIRYGIGVGRAGFAWGGRGRIGRKAKWPTWTPTQNMMRRDPELKKYAGGMKPGLNNPLGARALYIYDGGRDTLYRLHGTNEPASIGRAVSSGCIRLFNRDAIDLYERVPVGSRVIVKHGSAAV